MVAPRNLERIQQARKPFYPEIEEQAGTRRPSFRNRSRFLRVLEVKLRGEDVVVDGMVFESLASTLLGDWQFYFVIAEASNSVRHPAEWQKGNIVSLPNLLDEFLIDDPAKVTPGA